MDPVPLTRGYLSLDFRGDVKKSSYKAIENVVSNRDRDFAFNKSPRYFSSVTFMSAIIIYLPLCFADRFKREF